MSLKFPDFDEIRLNLGQCFQGRRQLVVILLFLVFHRLHPEHIHCDAAQTEGSKFHGLAGRINFGQFCLRQTVLFTKFRQLPARVFDVAISITNFRTRDQ